MKAPKARGAPVTPQRVRGWLQDFSGYRVDVTEGRIDRWIDQFLPKDKDLAARLLDSVEFVSRGRVSACFRQVLNQIPGWNPKATKRKGTWVFVPFTASAGESGDSMLHEFRIANGMGSKKFAKLFKYKSELPAMGLGPKDTIVFVDDFAGTGLQAVDHWEESLAELLPGEPNVYLVVVVAGTEGRKKIQDDTPLMVVSGSELHDSDSIFSDSCKHFSRSEKKAVLGYCKKVKPDEAEGFGDSGLLLVFSHRCPNNTIPILHESNERWEGLFRRSS